MRAGFSGNFKEQKTQSRTFSDGRDRRADGAYGQDFSQGAGSVKPFARYESELAIGKYHFGSIKLELSHSKFEFSTKLNGPEKMFLVNKNFNMLTEEAGFSGALIEGLKHSLIKGIGLDLDRITVREIAIESPGVSIGGILSSRSVGANAGAQLSALRITLDTPLGEISAKLRAGVGVGREVGRTYTKKGKPGVEKVDKVTFGVWEFIFKPTDSLDLKSSDLPSTPKEQQPVINAQIRAEKFLRQQAEKSPSVSPSQKLSKSQPSAEKPNEAQSNSIEFDLIDEAVEQMATSFSDKAEIVNYYEQYKQSKDKDGRPAAFVEFNRALQKHLKSEKQVKELIAAGVSTSIFLSQVASLTNSRELHNFASGLGAVTQIFSGMREVSNAISLLGSSSSLVSSALITTFTGFMGGAGLVLGGFSTVVSLLDNNKDDEGNNSLGEALSAIHSTVIGMWSEMRGSFKHTWERLDVIQASLGEMEKRNWQRFEIIMDAIEYTHNEVVVRLTCIELSVTGQLAQLQNNIESYLSHMVDHTAIEVVQNTGKKELLEIKKDLRQDTTTLFLWLTRTAAIKGRSGRIEFVHDQLVIEQTTLIQNLEKIIAPERDKSDFRLGLYGSLAQNIAKPLGETQFHFASITLINPQDWFKVLDVYLSILYIGKEDILQASPKVQKSYFAEIENVKQIADYTLQFLQQLASSPKFWRQLIANYQSSLFGIKQKLLAESETQRRKLNQEYRLAPELELLRLEESPQNSIERISQSNPTALTTTITPLTNGQFDLSWTPRGVISTPWQKEGENEVPFQLFGSWQTIKSQTEITESLITLINDPRFSLAYAYRQANIRGQSFVKTNTRIVRGVFGDPSFLRIHTQRTLFTLNIAGNQQLTICQHVHKYLQPAVDVMVSNPHYDGYQRQPEFNAFNYGQLLEVIETNILIPARKKIVVDTDIEANFALIAADIKKEYLQLVSFIQLIDPTFVPKPNPAIIFRIKTTLSTLSKTGSAEALKSLLDELHDHAWKEELSSYMGEHLIDFSIEDLIARLEHRLALNPLWQNMTVAQAQLAGLTQVLDPEINQEFFRKVFQADTQAMAAQQKNINQAILSLNHTFKELAAIDLISEESTYLVQKLGEAIRTKDSLMAQGKPLSTIIKQTLTIQDMNFLVFDEEVADTTPKSEEEKEPKLEPPKPSTYQELLKQFCANPAVDIAKVRAELIRLEAKSTKTLNRILNQNDLSQRPLHLAIRSSRADIVSLLLEYDARIEPETINFLNSTLSSSAKKIRALINFYAYMQHQGLEDPLPCGRILSLIQESLGALTKFHNLEGANIFIGKTGVGKSALTNSASGVDYELKVDGNNGNEYLEVVGNIQEKTKTGLSTSSETMYPQIVSADGYYFVDAPGFRATQGVAWDIVAELSMQSLEYSFKTISTIVLVCAFNDLYDPKMEGIRDSLDMLGKIIAKRPELMEHVILIVNKAKFSLMHADGPQKIKHRLEILAEEDDLSVSMKFILQQLTTQHIVVLDIPSRKFRLELLQRIKNIKPRPFSDFNFFAYQSKAEKFKTLLSRLKEYHQQAVNEEQSLKTLFIQSQHEILIHSNQTLASHDFISPNQELRAPSELMIFRQRCINQLNQQATLRLELLNLFSNTTSYLQTRYSKNQTASLIGSKKDVIHEIQECRNRIEVATTFFKTITPFIKYLKLERNFTEETPHEIKIPTTVIEEEIERAETNTHYSRKLLSIPAEVEEIEKSTAYGFPLLTSSASRTVANPFDNLIKAFRNAIKKIETVYENIPAIGYSFAIEQASSKKQHSPQSILSTAAVAAHSNFIPVEEKQTKPQQSTARHVEPGYSSFLQPLSGNDYLGVVFPYISHYMHKYLSFILPWNRENDLSDQGRQQLNAALKRRNHLEKNFAAQQKSRAATYDFLADKIDFVERELRILKFDIANLLAKGKASSSELSEVQSKLKWVEEVMHQLSVNNKKLRQFKSREKRLAKCSQKTGKQVSIVLHYNVTKNCLTQEVVHDSTKGSLFNRYIPLIKTEIESDTGLYSFSQSQQFWKRPEPSFPLGITQRQLVVETKPLTNSTYRAGC